MELDLENMCSQILILAGKSAPKLLHPDPLEKLLEGIE